MVSTRSRVVGEADTSSIDIVAIFEAQVVVQHEFMDFRKCSTEELDALREENVRELVVPSRPAETKLRVSIIPPPCLSTLL
ncbi:hypothetical protein LR48_Vigan08g101000 [Vigna angularis]|uniref:Uncharacterized protein n=1 Tax=Phaseolus angularis TaxID=3914 RepID=A0A0L9V5E3_PHAAN|nr:hypothetical protein LR48_Vigan08g101000 [Vigna angularis]